jgi:hypothetical protein
MVNVTQETAGVPLGMMAGPQERRIQLYGWDAQRKTWHGPNELGAAPAGNHRLVEALKNAPAKSWYGPVHCTASGEPRSRFFAVAHALADCAMAMVYCGESKTGPAEIVLVIPAERRARLRPEFAFEFVAFAGFLGSLGSLGADLAVHDHIINALAESGREDSLVFSISTGLADSERDLMLSRCVEKLAVAMLEWMGD